MKDKFVLISGSASYESPQVNLDTAFAFLRSFTRNVLSRGGGLVVLGTDENSTKDEHGTPHLFDWVVLREIANYAETTAEPPRSYARVVMSDEAYQKKIDDTNLRVLTNLQQRNAVELHHIQHERFTGGTYRKAMVAWSDAMLGIGGGKGTYAVGKDMAELSKPVLPLDLGLGSSKGDGEGAEALHKEMMSNPRRFFLHTYCDVINKTGLMGLNRGVNDAEGAAQVAVELIEKELSSVPQETWQARATKPLVRAWQFAKALPVVSATIKIIESILRSAG